MMSIKNNMSIHDTSSELYNLDETIYDKFKELRMDIQYALCDIKFKKIIKEDQYRLDDILNNRRIVADKLDTLLPTFDLYDPNMAELIASVAIKWSDTYDTDGNNVNTPGDYFMEMLDNLGLLGSGITYRGACEILEDCVDRKYGMDGKGSLFPLPEGSEMTQDNCSIWAQLNNYLIAKNRYFESDFE